MFGIFKVIGIIKGLMNYLLGNVDFGDIICEINVFRLMVVFLGKVLLNLIVLF